MRPSRVLGAREWSCYISGLYGEKSRQRGANNEACVWEEGFPISKKMRAQREKNGRELRVVGRWDVLVKWDPGMMEEEWTGEKKQDVRVELNEKQAETKHQRCLQELLGKIYTDVFTVRAWKWMIRFVHLLALVAAFYNPCSQKSKSHFYSSTQTDVKKAKLTCII